MLHQLSDIAQCQEFVRLGREQGIKTAFVPTMGNLHSGHMALVETAKQRAQRVVVSIFVNPLQFDRQDDLQAYPRTLQADLALLSQAQVDAVFLPTAALMYPHASMFRVQAPAEIANLLEGASRPGHFDGVATVVTKLFQLLQPDMAVFGQKDFQQLLLVRRLVADLNIPVEIIAEATARAKDGLALSSRNGYLSHEERAQAPRLHQELSRIASDLETVELTESRMAELCERSITTLNAAGFQVDYLTVRDAETLQLATAASTQLVVLVAAWLGKARLIDNLLLPSGFRQNFA